MFLCSTVFVLLINGQEQKSWLYRKQNTYCSLTLSTTASYEKHIRVKTSNGFTKAKTAFSNCVQVHSKANRTSSVYFYEAYNSGKMILGLLFFLGENCVACFLKCHTTTTDEYKSQQFPCYSRNISRWSIVPCGFICYLRILLKETCLL
jgi:hypothetical protein